MGHAWLLDARVRTLEIYRLHEGKWLLVDTFADQDRIRAEPFDALELERGNLWADLPTRASEPVADYGG